KDGGREKSRRLLCANRHRYGAAACPDGSTGFSHDYVMGVVFELLADTLLRDGAAERLTGLAEARADEADRQREAARLALVRRLADLDGDLARSGLRLATCPEDLVEHVQAGIRQLKQQKAEAAAELEKVQAEETVAAEADPRR